MTDLAGLLAVLDFERTGDQQFRATHVDEGHGVVFGGQLVARAVVAATRTVPDKELLSVHSVFARGGIFDEPIVIDLDVMASGRSMDNRIRAMA